MQTVGGLRARLALCLVAAFWLSACVAAAPPSEAPATPTRIAPSEGKGGLVGTIANADAFWPDATLTIYAAEFVGPEDSGMFVLEPNIFPHSQVGADGQFQISEIPPSRYVLLVGPAPEDSKLLGIDGKHQVYAVSPDTVTDVGSVTIVP